MERISCLLCKGSQPTSLNSFLHSLNNFLNSPLPCPVPFCHQVLQGALQLSEHLAAHPETSGDLPGGQVQATTAMDIKSQPASSTHVSSNRQEEPKGENIEQVLRDLEELVDRDLSAKQQDEKATQQASSLPEVDQMADWPSNSIVAFPSIQLPSISDPSPSSSAWLTQTSSSPSLGPLSPPRPSLRSAPYKRGGSGGVQQVGTTRGGGNTEVACGQCGWMFDNANFLQLHRVLMHSRRRETKSMTLPEHYLCKQCSGPPTSRAVFPIYEMYVDHLRTAHGETRHVCKFCAKLFKLKGSLLVHQRVMHQPINERVTNLVATRQETTLEQIHKYANTKIQETTLEQQPALPHHSLAFSPLIKQEGLAGEEGKANDQGVREQESGSSLERGEINPKVEISDGASLVCRTCNKVRLNEAFSLSPIKRN